MMNYVWDNQTISLQIVKKTAGCKSQKMETPLYSSGKTVQNKLLGCYSQL